MDLVKCLAVLAVLCFHGSESGGHGGKHHDHVKLHMPEFIHHDHHTKIITIHHHHQKPKEHHHHHHHHHHKPHHKSHGHHHHHKKTTHKVVEGHTVKKHHGHGHHSHHGHGHHGHGHHGHGHHGHGHHGYGHHGHHGHHGHQGHGHHHHDFPSVNYEPTSVGYEEDVAPYAPPLQFTGNALPHVHGIQHTVKQVKVYDSLPGVIPSVSSAGSGPGYQVTEEGDEDDSFTSINSVQQTFPDTYSYLRGAAPQPSHDPFAGLNTQNAIHGHDPFSTVAQPTAGVETYTGIAQNDPFASSAPTALLPGASSTPEFVTYQEDFNNPGNSFIGDVSSTPLLSVDETAATDDYSPVSYHREAGIQQVVKTGGMETLTY